MKQIIIKTLLGIVVALCSLNANAQVKAFEKYADAKNVTYVYISKYMLAMAGKNATPSVPGVDIKTLAGKLTGIQIINTENKAAQAKLKNDVKGIISSFVCPRVTYCQPKMANEIKKREKHCFLSKKCLSLRADNRGWLLPRNLKPKNLTAC